MIHSAYIDTSFLLSIIFEDDNYGKSVDCWNEIEIYLSSILLEIESRINIYKYFKVNLKEEKLYNKKLIELKELIENINRKTVDSEILLEIQNIEKLQHLKSLDSIHLATANIFNKLNENRLRICTYDKNMIKIAKDLGMEVI